MRGPDSGNAVLEEVGQGGRKETLLPLFLPLSALLEKETGKKMAALGVGWRAAGVSMLTFADRHFCSLGIRK